MSVTSNRELAGEGWLTILDAAIRFLARARREGLLGRGGSDFDGINVNTAGDAWLKTVLITRIYDLFAWACAENEVVRLDLLRQLSDQWDLRIAESYLPNG